MAGRRLAREALVILVSAATLALPAAHAEAEDRATKTKAGRTDLGGFVGAYVPSNRSTLGNTSRTGISTSVLFGPRFGYWLNERLAIEVELPVSFTSTDDDTANLVLLFPRAQVLYDVYPNDSATPLLFAGVGAPIIFSDDGGNFSSDATGSLYLGAGVAVEQFDTVGFRVDAAFIATPGLGSRFLAPEFQLLFGVYWNGLRDLRKPRIKAPPPPRPKKPDSDGDGITDDIDECPDRPEDQDNIEDADGCPELDIDGDGVLDGSDRCQDELETVNGFDDEDGCPDELPPELSALEGTLTGVRFGSGSATLAAGARTRLNRVASLLREHPSVRLIVAGHTDDRGDPDENSRLSLDRASAVADYLIKRGIRPYRLIVLGVGSTEPLADNESAQGRAQNRRIELRIWVREQ